MKIKMLLFITAIALVAISSGLYAYEPPEDGYKTLGYLQKGMPLSDFIQTPETEAKVTKDNKNYTLLVPQKDIKTYNAGEGLGEIRVIFYPFLFKRIYSKNIIRTKNWVNMLDCAILAFEADKLIYWGFPEDFLKSQETKLNQIGELFYDDYKQILKETWPDE